METETHRDVLLDVSKTLEVDHLILSQQITQVLDWFFRLDGSLTFNQFSDMARHKYSGNELIKFFEVEIVLRALPTCKNARQIAKALINI